MNVSLDVYQLTSGVILKHQDNLEEVYDQVFTPHTEGQVWMSTSNMLMRRFGLHKFKDFDKESISNYEWDENRINKIAEHCFKQVRNHLNIDHVNITFVPAIRLPFPWFDTVEKDKWTNGFCNGPGNIIVAIPAEPDEEYLLSMLAHEMHHACKDNPIYKIPYDQFTLSDTIVMEGSAEYFSQLLFHKERYWFKEFTPDIEQNYWKQVSSLLNSTDEKLKMKYSFGYQAENIPTFAAYSFGYRVFQEYMKKYPSIYGSSITF